MFPARPALCLGIFLVVHALVLVGRDNGEAVFFAKPVTDLTHIIVDFLVALVCVMVYKIHGIENQMIVDVTLIGMCRKHIFVLAFEDLICKFLSDFMGDFRRDFSRLKGLDNVSGFDLYIVHAFLRCYPPRKLKFLRGGFWRTGIAGNIELPLGLAGVHNIVEGFVYSSSDSFDFSDRHT